MRFVAREGMRGGGDAMLLSKGGTVAFYVLHASAFSAVWPRSGIVPLLLSSRPPKRRVEATVGTSRAPVIAGTDKAHADGCAC